jgi:hypothetical protein
MIEPMTTIVIPFIMCYIAIVSVKYARRRWRLRNVDDGSKYSRWKHKFGRARCRITGRPVPPKFECLEGHHLN